MKVSINVGSLSEVYQLTVPELSSIKSSPEIGDTSCAMRTLSTFNTGIVPYRVIAPCWSV